MKTFQNISLIIFLLLAATVLNGCSIAGTQSSPDGGVFISYNFGDTWEQKAFVNNEGASIASVGTNFIRFDPADENIVYLITYGAGIYKSTNAGNQWTPTGLAGGTYNSMSIDSRNNDVLYVTEGIFIRKSVDGGITWKDIYQETRPSQSIVAILVDPFSPNIVYAATTSGLIKSFDYGNTWELLDWSTTQILQLHISTKNRNVLYAFTNLGPTKGISKSSDGGSTWTALEKNLESFDRGQKIRWLDFDPQTENIILGTEGGIVRSFDGANTWEVVPTLFDFQKIPITTVIQNPNNYNEIIFSVNNLLQKSDDRGKTWEVLKTVQTLRTINYLANDPYRENVVFLGTVPLPQ
ncbi:MAG: hypothetical protein WC505_02615 [Patescibacteria group bacterium]